MPWKVRPVLLAEHSSGALLEAGDCANCAEKTALTRGMPYLFEESGFTVVLSGAHTDVCPCCGAIFSTIPEKHVLQEAVITHALLPPAERRAPSDMGPVDDRKYWKQFQDGTDLASYGSLPLVTLLLRCARSEGSFEQRHAQGVIALEVLRRLQKNKK